MPSGHSVAYSSTSSVTACHLQIANSLFSKKIIPTQVKDKVLNPHLDITERVVALLDCVESRMEAVPSDFNKVVHILEEEPFLESLAKDLVESYCKGLMQNVLC